MLPFETPTIFEQLPRFIFQMPRVVPDQKTKFENDELFRKLSRESEVILILARVTVGMVTLAAVAIWAWH